jgi:acyl carrier protein
MKPSRDEIMADVLALLRKLADDWEYSGQITPETRFFADMGLRSLDVVVLGTAIQEHYKQVFPFVKLFAQVGQRAVPDMPVGEWVDFISEHMQDVPAAAAAPPAGGRG